MCFRYRGCSSASMSRMLKWQHSADASSGAAAPRPSRPATSAKGGGASSAAPKSRAAAAALLTIATMKGSMQAKAAPDVKRSAWKDLDKQAENTPALMMTLTTSGRSAPAARPKTSSSNVGSRSSTTRCIAVSARKSTVIIIRVNDKLPALPNNFRMTPPNEVSFSLRPTPTISVKVTSVVKAKKTNKSPHLTRPHFAKAKGSVRMPVPMAVAARFTAADSGVPSNLALS
mmetsp:Transcript_29919/g.75353  ORF Transcript_29919/g.75353 Transcript_29919/m.75353 type:complete len:230 (+) Transcript_29919:470-1159(+)